MEPLRREWRETRQAIENLLQTGKVNPTGKERPLTKDGANKAYREARAKLRKFHERLAHVKVLDPACGSGNFLYVTLQKLKDLEKEVLVYAGDTQLGSFLPQVGPWQFYGIEINPYAFELAQTTLWIGYLQWIQANGFGEPAEPILREMDNFRNMDAVVDLSEPDHPNEPEWPAADFIVGNPPFLGSKRMRTELGDQYVDALLSLYTQRVPAEADLVVYWFEKARQQIENRASQRAGLLATQGIRGSSNREVLKRIKQTGNIFFAESDRDWVLDGANVHISMIGFDDGTEQRKCLDGRPVDSINANLTGAADTTIARQLRENTGLCLRPPEKGGKFELDDETALEILAQPNPHGRPNSDVVRLWVNAESLVQNRQRLWIIDFSKFGSESAAAAYEKPFEYIARNVRSFRSGNRDERLRRLWWMYRRSGDGVREASAISNRLLCTPMVSKYRIFTWIDSIIQPDKTTYCFARDDDYFFGILSSRLHEIWGLKLGTRLETRPRYTPTTTFETFAFPHPTSEQRAGITAAAKELHVMRTRWLDPPEWTREEILEFTGSVDGPWARYVTDANTSGIGNVRYCRVVPKDDKREVVAGRTLTKLYNERPAWLDLAHRQLDEAVFAAYGWESTLSDEDILARLLALNQERAPVESSIN